MIARLALRPAVVATCLVLPTLLSGCFLIPRMDRHGLIALEEGRPMAGAWLGSWPTEGNPVISQFEDETGVRLDLVDVYLDWNTPYANVSHSVKHIARHGALPILTWEAQTVTTHDIIDGSRMLPLRDGRRLSIDSYVAEFAKGACRSAAITHQPVLIRMLHEMNGNWFAWSVGYERDGKPVNDDASYKQAWVKLHDAFTSRCGDDVRFIWAVNHFSVGQGTSFMGTYPGDDYVDLVGIDGYNWGTKASWGWQDFYAIFQDGLCTLERSTSKPILIAEVGSSEAGGDKARWISDLLANIEARERLRGFVWLNDEKYEVQIDGRMDWDLQSSPKALQAFSNGTRKLLDVDDLGPPEVPPCR
jgi:Glycosyl hydrolase family 26